MIFYYSATGNSKWLAQEIASRTGEETTDIESACGEDEYSYAASSGEALGFVFPVYFCAMPDIVKNFIQKLKVSTSDRYYCFVAITCGSSFGTTIRSFVRAMARQGLTVNASFVLRTIDTFLPFFQIPEGDARKALEEDSKVQADVIGTRIVERACGSFEPKASFSAAQSVALGLMYKIMRRTRYLHVTDACSGCGLCSEHCPLHVIEIDRETHKPQWKSKTCMMCFRCVHHCPQSAIEYSRLTQGKLRYRSDWGE